MTTGKTIALTRWTLVGKVMSLLFNMLSRSVLAFLPRSNCLISWLQLLSAVILEPRKVKSVTVSTFSPSVCHEVMGLDAVIFVFLMLSFKPAFPHFIPVVMTSGMVCGLPTEVVSSFYVSYEFSPKAVLLKGIAKQGT